MELLFAFTFLFRFVFSALPLRLPDQRCSGARAPPAFVGYERKQGVGRHAAPRRLQPQPG